MADKDMTERDVMRQELPDASLLICLFHVLRTFRSEVSQDKLTISIVERTTSLDLLQGMTYATSPEAYDLCILSFVACHKHGHGLTQTTGWSQ